MGEDRRPDPDELFVADPATLFADTPEKPERPKWPGVVGAISMTYGALAVGLGCLGLVVSLQGGGGGIMGAPSSPTPPGVIAQAAASLAWTALLIIAGALLMSRRRIGRTLHLIWAMGAIALGVWGLFAQAAQQARMIRAMEERGTSPEMIELAQSLTPYTVGCAAAIGFAWPLFCLVWFGLVKRNPEDLTGGVEPGM